MPQPLSKVNPGAIIFIGNSGDNPSDHRPDLALLAMKVVSEWSILESFMSTLLVQMLGNNLAVGSAMYLAIESDRTRHEVLKAVGALSVKSQDERDVFEAIMSFFKTAAKDRNKIAHWVWGNSPDIKDGVLLCDPEALIEYRVAMEVYNATIDNSKVPMPASPEFPRDKVLVYFARDFEGASQRIQKLIGYVSSFTALVNYRRPANRDGTHLFSMLHDPEIREFVSRQRANRKAKPLQPHSP